MEAFLSVELNGNDEDLPIKPESHTFTDTIQVNNDLCNGGSGGQPTSDIEEESTDSDDGQMIIDEDGDDEGEHMVNGDAEGPFMLPEEYLDVQIDENLGE